MSAFVAMYNPALPGSPHVLAPVRAEALYAAHGWLAVDGTTPPPADIYLTPGVGDLRYAPIGSAGGGGLTVAATVTASGALVSGKHNPVDATSAAKTMTLPTGTSAKLLSVEKTDATANAVTVTGNIRGVSSSSISLVWQRETLLLASDSSGSWWPIAGHKTKTTLDAAYGLHPNIAGGRVPLASRLSSVIGASVQAPQNAPRTDRTAHFTATGGTDWRLQYGADLAAETDGATNPVQVKVGFEYPSGTVTPVTFGGKQTTTWEPGGTTPISDPVPVDVPAGSTVFLRAFLTTLFGPYRTIATDASAGATSIVLNSAPATQFVNNLPQTITVGTEQVTCTAVSGSTLTITALASGRLTGVVVGQQTIGTATLFGDQGGAQTVSSVDNSWTTTTLGTLSTTTTTLTAAASAGDRSIKVAGQITGPTLTVDTAGSAETVTVTNYIGEANPYTVYLAAPLTNAHSSGATVSPATGSSFLLAPTTITADRPLTTPPPAIHLGACDSIVNGVGYNERSGGSYLKDALDSLNRVYVDASKAGEALFQWVALATSRRRRTLMSLCGWGYVQQATNDIWGTRSLAQVQADLLTTIALAHSRGMKIAVQTVIPRTTSTDNWATTTNQTKNATFEPIRVAYNAWLVAGSSGADLVVPAHQALDSGLSTGGAETGLWLAADATNGAYTASGLHPSYLGHQALKTWLLAGGYLSKMV